MIMVNRTFTHGIVDNVDKPVLLRPIRPLLLWITPPYFVDNVENHGIY